MPLLSNQPFIQPYPEAVENIVRHPDPWCDVADADSGHDPATRAARSISGGGHESRVALHSSQMGAGLAVLRSMKDRKSSIGTG